MSEALATTTTIQRATWRCGADDASAELFAEVDDVVAEAAAIAPGMVVLDVVTGNADGAVAAADALPFDDASCDRVLSTFGVMFAPRHEVAAGELVRACRPGGMIVLASWTPDGFIGRILELVARHAPTRSGGSAQPALWGDEAYLRALLGGQVLLAMERRTAAVVFESPDAMLSGYEQQFGPLVRAKRELEPERYGALVGELRALIETSDTGDGELRIPAEYLLVVGLKP